MSDHDERAIISVINLYAIAMDARRWDLFDRIFTDDVDADYSGPHWYDLSTFKTDFARAHEIFDATQHVMMNHLVDVAADSAKAFTYCSWRLALKGTEGGDFLHGTAWYDDVLARSTKGWLIKRRTCRILWSDGNPRVIGASEGHTWSLLALRRLRARSAIWKRS